MSRRVLCKRVEQKYTFIKSRNDRFPVSLTCKVLKVHRSGYFAWLQYPQCQRKKGDAHLLGYVKQFWPESGGVYGYRKITKDIYVYQRVKSSDNNPLPWVMLGFLGYICSLSVMPSITLKQLLCCPLEHAEGVDG
jgi:hypothetical protein